MARFTVETGSALGHGCCFEATVFEDGKVLCECFDEASAERIAAVLNAAEATNNDQVEKESGLA